MKFNWAKITTKQSFRKRIKNLDNNITYSITEKLMKKRRNEPVKKLTGFRVLRAYEFPLNPESKLVSSFEPQEIRSSECYLPQHHFWNVQLSHFSTSFSPLLCCSGFQQVELLTLLVFPLAQVWILFYSLVFALENFRSRWCCCVFMTSIVGVGFCRIWASDVWAHKPCMAHTRFWPTRSFGLCGYSSHILWCKKSRECMLFFNLAFPNLYTFIKLFLKIKINFFWFFNNFSNL